MKKIAYFFLFYVFLSSHALAQQTLPPELIRYADLVVLNGKVLTVDKNFSIAEAVAVRDGKILAVGSSIEIQRFMGPNTKKVNAGGKSVIPGCIDSNGDNSFVGGDLYKLSMINGIAIEKRTVVPWIPKDLLVKGQIGGKDLKEIFAKIKVFVELAKPDSNVYVRFLKENQDITKYITAKDLDEVAPNNPLMCSINSSEGIVNTAMLEKAFAEGLRKDYFGVVKDDNGIPTGQLFGQALFFIGSNLRDWPEITEKTFKEQESIVNMRLKDGVTTLTGHGSGFTVTVLSQMYHLGRLNIRIRPDFDFSRQNILADQFIRRIPNLVNFSLGDGMIQVAGAAVGPVDGNYNTGDMMTNEPKLRIHPDFGGGPYGDSKWCGSVWNNKQFADLTEKEKCETDWRTINLLFKHGWNIGGIHNMGAGASVIVMETMLEAEKQPDIKVHNIQRRHMLDHNLLWDEKSITLAKQLGDKIAFGLMTEIFQQSRKKGKEMLFYQYGEKMHTMQPVKDLLQAGFNVHIEGSDEENPPMWRIQRYVTRTDGRGRVWGKDQALDRKQAMQCLTINAAKFISEEDMLGSIEKGKYADLVVLSGDYMTIPEDKLITLKPVMTIVGGKVVYEAK